MKLIRKIFADSSPESFEFPGWRNLVLMGALSVLAGCATTALQKSGVIPIMAAETEIPESQLLDVGILQFESEPINAEKAEKEGTHPEIRKAETLYIPYHLKETMQRTSHWGAVRVIPEATDSVDLLVTGKIIESNGQHMAVQISAVDAAGNRWLNKKYEMTADKTRYGERPPGQPDPFQNVYNAVANDLARHKTALTPQELTAIREIARLKFAGEFAPAAFGDNLRENEEGKPAIAHLPADEDPMMARVLKIRDREHMFVDTLNAYYEKFYTAMQPSYENWRQLNLDERLAVQKIRREAMYRQLAGALLVAGAILLGATDSGNTGGLQAGMVIIGAQVFVGGLNVSKEADMHAEAIEELGESFGGEMQPITMEVEGKQYELSGSAKEQFQKWRHLLQQIYASETGSQPESPEEIINRPPE